MKPKLIKNKGGNSVRTSILKADMRHAAGSVPSKRLRQAGWVPAVVYGRHKETKEVKVKVKDVEKIIEKRGYGTIFHLELGQSTIPAIIKEVQRHITKDHMLHIDFQELLDNQRIKLNVPIILEGREDLEDAFTIIQQQVKELSIQCLPKYIPQSITENALKLKENSTLAVKDLEINKEEHIEVLNDPEELIAMMTSTMKQETDEEPETISIFRTDKSILDMD